MQQCAELAMVGFLSSNYSARFPPSLPPSLPQNSRFCNSHTLVEVYDNFVSFTISNSLQVPSVVSLVFLPRISP